MSLQVVPRFQDQSKVIETQVSSIYGMSCFGKHGGGIVEKLEQKPCKRRTLTRNAEWLFKNGLKVKLMYCSSIK